MEAAEAPPPALLAELRRHRGEVAHLLALRVAVAARGGEEPGPHPTAAGDAEALLRAAVGAAAALAAADPEVALERAETAAALAAEARGEFGVPTSSAEHERALAGLRRAALARLP
jgi:hypothetical protein